MRDRKIPFLGWLLLAAAVASALVLFLGWHIYESHRFFGHIGTEFIRQTETITEIRALRWELTQAAHHLVLFGQGEDRREAYDAADQRLASVLAAGSNHAGEIPGVASLAGLAGRLGVIERKAMAAAREGRKDEGIGLLHSAEYIEGTRALCAEADGHARAVYSRLQDRLRAHGRSELAFFAIDISVLLFAVGLWWLLGLRLRRWRERAEAELSRRVEAEEQLRRSQKMEALGQMAAGIGHDFKNVLGTIMGYADLASRAAEQGRTDMASLRGIQAAAQQGVAVMGAMLTFSHDTKPEKRPVDLCALLTEATDLLRQTLPSSIRISTRSDVAEDACWILGDRSQLQQVLLNLALNAGDAMPNGGKLSVSLTAGAYEAASGVAGDTRPAVCLEVTDTGKGIAPEIRERIFEPFFTTKARGQSTGLGLAIVHAIAMDHGATIDVSSVPGEGATFRLCFRRDAAPAARPAAPSRLDRAWS